MGLGRQRCESREQKVSYHVVGQTACICRVRQAFPGRLMNKNGDIPWSPRSPDLPTCDLFPTRTPKNKCFTVTPKDYPGIKRNRREVAETPL